MEQSVPEKKEEKYKIFGDVDRNKDGKIKSEYPSWYHISQKEDLEESIRHRETVIERDLIPRSEQPTQRARLKQEKERLDQIEAAQPRFSGKELDEVAKITISLGKKITEAMYRRSDGEKGIADAHEVARRWSNPCIKLEDAEISFVKACDIIISHDGKVNQVAAEKAWKIGRRLIGEGSNTEILRKS